MASAIGKGDWLQCIDVECDGAEGVICGGVYCIETLTPPQRCEYCGDDGPGFELVGVPPDDDMAWCPRCQFRPLGGNAKTLTAPPQRVSEDA